MEKNKRKWWVRVREGSMLRQGDAVMLMTISLCHCLGTLYTKHHIRVYFSVHWYIRTHTPICISTHWWHTFVLMNTGTLNAHHDGRSCLAVCRTTHTFRFSASHIRTIHCEPSSFLIKSFSRVHFLSQSLHRNLFRLYGSLVAVVQQNKV
jgi:hypothetical protein